MFYLQLKLVQINEVSKEKILNYKCSKHIEGLDFFRNDALKSHKNSETITYVLLSDDSSKSDYTIIGFFTYSFRLVGIERSIKEKLGIPKRKGGEYLTMYLDRFGLDDSFKSQDDGKGNLYSTILMFNFFYTAAIVKNNVPIVFLTLHAVPGTELFYEKFDFVKVRPEKLTTYYTTYIGNVKDLIDNENDKSIFYNIYNVYSASN